MATKTKKKSEKRLKKQKKILSQPRIAKNISRYDIMLGFIESPDTMSIEDYERMVDTDETVSAAFELIGLTVNHFIKDYKHKNDDIQSFVRKNLEEMETPLDEVIEAMLTALWVGFSLQEVELESRDDGRVWIKDVHSVKPHHIEMKVLTEGPRQGEVVTYYQNRFQSDKVEIPEEKCILFTHRGRFGNKYGLSRLRSVFKNWFLKDVLLKAWASTLERYGSPIGVGKTDTSACVVDEDTGETINRADEMMESLESLQGGSVLVIDTGEEISFEQVQRAFGEDFENAQKHFNNMIFRGLLMPSLVFDSGDIGSNAMANKHYEIFARAVWSLRSKICRLIIKRTIQPVVHLNFGPQENYGYFDGTVLEEEDRKLLADIFFSNVSIGLLDPTNQKDFDMMRGQMSYPLRDAPTEAPQASATGKDGLPGQAPDGQDDSTPGAPNATPRAPKKPQGRGASNE